jgi:hypothetical protein
MRKLESVLAVALFLTIALIAAISSIAAALAVVITAIVLAVVVGLERKLVALACVIAVLVFAVPAFADTAPAPSSGSSGIVDTILALAITALAGVAGNFALNLWSMAKAAAAHSAAKWDDEAVAFVEQIAQGVVDGKKVSAKGPVTDH